MSKYHISPNGKPGICSATIKCKYAENGVVPEHYDSKEQAQAAYEKQMQTKVLKTVAKEPINNSGMKTYGVGKPKKLADPKHKWFGENDIVQVRSCENVPDQRREEWDDPYTDYEEVILNGEIAGYICKDGEGNWCAQTVEKINDPVMGCLRPENWVYSRTEAASKMIEKFRISQKPLELSEDHDFLDKYRQNPKVEKIDDRTQLYIESDKPVFNGIKHTNYHIFLVKDGKPVSFIKVMDEPETENSPRRTARCDIETRYTERNKGYAKEISSLVEKYLGNKLSSSGGFTADGYRAFHSKEDDEFFDTKPSFDPMNFVADWDTLKPYYNL